MADDAGLLAVVRAHQRAGRQFEAGGLTSFAREAGEGEPVVLVHGLPSSSFLYRKMLPELASRGLRALAFDLPGLGLADRPGDSDYTFAGLGRFAAAAVDALELDRFHLVVRQDGGAAYLRIMANLRRGHGDYRAVVDSRTTPYPAQVVWGTKDPILPFTRHGWRARDAAHVPAICAVPAKHYLQEEQAPAISQLVGELAARAHGVQGRQQ